MQADEECECFADFGDETVPRQGAGVTPSGPGWRAWAASPVRGQAESSGAFRGFLDDLVHLETVGGVSGQLSNCDSLNLWSTVDS